MKRIILTIVLAVLALPGIVATDLARGLPNAPAGPAAVAADYRVMPLGDSITLGIGEPGLNGWRNDLLTGGFNWLNPDYVGICPHADPAWKCIGTPTMADKQHSGSSGWRSDEIALRVSYYMDWFNPQTVTLMAGANDVGYPYGGPNWLPNYGERMKGIVQTILAKRPGTHIFVMTMTQFRDQRSIVTTMNNDLVANMNSLNSSYVHIVPTHIVGDEPAKELADHVHPNACGYARIAYVLYTYMEPVYSPGMNWPAIPNPFYTTTGPC